MFRTQARQAGMIMMNRNGNRAARARVLRVSAAEAERQLVLAAWLVALLAAATGIAATLGFMA